VIPSSSSGRLDHPYGVCSDPSDNIYVADTYNHRVQKFDPNGVYLSQWGTWGIGDGQFVTPTGVCSDPSGNIYVVDTGNDRVQKFDANGVYLSQWGAYGTGNGQFQYPQGVCSDPSGSIYVADTNNNRVQKFDPDGVYLTQWGTEGAGEGEFENLTSVCSDPSGGIYVADTNNNRVQKFNSNGVYITQWGTPGCAGGQFQYPQGVCSDPSGNIYVADTGNDRVQKFNSNGVYMTQWGTEGAGNGQFEIPVGVCSDAAGSLYVADTSNGRIQKFAYQTPPIVISTSPMNGATGVPVTTAIKATFNRTMNASTINTSTFLVRNGGAVSGSVTYYPGNLTAVFVPSAPLQGMTLYTVNITTGVAAVTGDHMLANYVWSFTTIDTTPPAVTLVSPLNGASGVPVTTFIKAVFSEAMNASTINTSTFLVRNGGPVAGSVTYYPGNLTAVFVPSAPLLTNTLYTVNVTRGVADLAGNHPASNFVWAFTTAAPPVPNAVYVSDTIPPSMIAGNSYGVSVTFMNTGNVDWTAADLFRLGSVGDAGGDAAKFGPLRVNIEPGIVVQPGQSYTFNFIMTAPFTAGTYHPSYQMVWDGHQWFGSILVKTVSVGAATPNAVVVSNTLPSSMVAGQSYPVSITMRNTGNINWTAAGLFRLGAIGADAAKFGVQRVNILAGVVVQPGQSYTFNFIMTAPATAATYSPSYQMVWEGQQWFGGISTKTIVVSAVLPNAAFVSDTIPSTMARGSSHPVSITMRNTGNINWTAADLFRLGAVGGAGGDAAKFGVQRVNITAGVVVQPDQSYTFSFTMIAPGTAGTYHPTYQMVWDGHQWFGATDAKTTIVT
jgi:sugar lactone lactonase YvrE